ncbi:hypothetical protein O181_018365 [Austropuccinia psidii MF-1]|uniref:Uncharacterized protein n=1 Tax=Austropuccinia psidii MF-1 TaxID=1389203 RepID=A0A9Q3C9Q7_9BASI|nr:hypothetical protein [Austropuccinia psidii MF-1]
MGVGTGNVKITHHVKFLQNSFPVKKDKNNETNENTFTLVLNKSDTSFSNPIPVHSNEVPISNTPEITAEEPIDVHLLSLPNQNPQVTDHDIPVQKGYSWIPEHKINTSKERIGNVGDPENILNHSR